MSTLRRARARLRIRVRKSRRVFDQGREGKASPRRARVGSDATRRQIARSAERLRELGARAGRIAARLAPIATAVVAAPLVVAGAAIAFAARIGGWIARQLDALSAVLRPEWAVAGVAAAASVLLGLSQFVRYSAVEVSAQGYGNVGQVAPPPLAAARDAGSAHAYVLLGVAVVSLVLIAITLRGRWRLGRLVALCGVVGVVVTLAIDLPKGLDAGRAGLSFAESSARLLEGFYAQLAASAVLAYTGALLAVFEHRANPAPRARRRRARGRRGRAPSPSRRFGAPRSAGGSGA